MSGTTPADRPLRTAAASAYARPAPLVDHARLGVSGYFFLHASAAVFPLTAGLALFGWRAALAVGIVVGSAAGFTALWRSVGRRGAQLHFPQVLWLALLLALMLPAELAAHFSLSGGGGGGVAWPILPAAAGLLVILCWMLGGIGSAAVHPVVVTFLLLALLYGPAVSGHHVLQRDASFAGDVTDAGPAAAVLPHDPWYRRASVPDHPAVLATPAADTLSSYTTGQASPDRAWLSLEGLLRDRLPPLEDVILGAQPGPIGAGSGIAVIVGGLMLIYRQLIDFRVPLLIMLTAFVVLLVLPVPAVITDRPQWRWAVGHAGGIGWPVGITLANYEMLATPLPFVAFFLAASPGVGPLTRGGRAIFAISVGAMAAALQLYVSASLGAYLALLAGGVMMPGLEWWIRPRRPV